MDPTEYYNLLWQGNRIDGRLDRQALVDIIKHLADKNTVRMIDDKDEFENGVWQ